MRLKSLELHGFKSFVDKTALNFGSGVTGVVGPNGCGKSNIVDAIRWAMGEQSAKRLRGRGMEDVIFGGAEGVSPVGMAEVMLTFDNRDGDGPPSFAAYSEIQVARRLYRTGESEYLLNGTSCRLRDVQDFFRDTGIGVKGYTVVEQGQIAEIVSAKPEDRRVLIEEAAGIGKYKARRREAESKISSTEQNLLRVNDVLGEIRRQIGSIERQAKKAARFKRLRETLRILELSLALDDRRGFEEEIAAANQGLIELRDAVTALEAQAEERELAAQNKRIELAERDRALAEGSERLLALRTDIKECEARIDYGRRERSTLGETIASRGQELERLAEQLEARTGEVSEAEVALESVQGTLGGGREQLEETEAEAAGAREALAELERQRDAENQAYVEVLTEIARAEDRHATVEDRRAELVARMRSADEGLEVGQSEAQRVDTEQSSLEEGLRNLLAERDRLMGLHRTALDNHEQRRIEAREAAEALLEAREAREARRSRLDSLEELVERRDELLAGTRHLLEQSAGTRDHQGLKGLVRDVLEVDREAERAVEAVLADCAGAIIVDRPEGALEALDLLRSTTSGRGMFVAPTSAREVPSGFVPLGEPLLAKVRPRPGYEDVARRLLSDVNVVKSLSEVLDVYGNGRIPCAFVTLEGDLLTPDGVLTGGSHGNSGTGLITRMGEIRDLQREVADLEARVQGLEARHGEAEQELVRATDELENLRNRHHTAALAVANHEKDLERTRERVKALGEAHEGRVAERSEILSESEALQDESERWVQNLTGAREARTQRQRELDALGLRIGSAGRELGRLETLATERRVELAGREDHRDRAQAELERATRGVTETSEWIARREAEIRDAEAKRVELRGVIDNSQVQLDQRLVEEEVARSSSEEKREAYEQVVAEVESLETASRELRASLTRRREEVGAQELVAREAELKQAHLDDGIREKWNIELASWTLPPLEPEAETAEVMPASGLVDSTSQAEEEVVGATEEDSGAAPDALREARRNAELAHAPREERTTQFEQIRNKLQQLGDVNLGAIEEHEELSERFRFLSEQKADLDGTLQSLRDAIARINRTSRRRFRETFEQVAERFTKNFPRLFNGGKASLTLTESEDVLEAGIEIMAMPPGKRLQSVNLLSGGEKTLTAIALLVSVFQVRPCPFFLLDEVDAALDDTNVGRFNEIVRELSDTSQFVLITHNKQTIEIVDRLYGVTMERKGMSKLVSVEIA